MKTVVIVGAGIVGLCTAKILSESGHEVIVIDSEPEDFARCSSGNSGMIVPSHITPLAAPGMVGYGFKMLFQPNSPFGFSPTAPELARWLTEFAKAANASQAELAAPLLHRLQAESLDLYAKWCEELGVPLLRRGLAMLCLSERALEQEAIAAADAAKLGIESKVYDRSELKDLDPNVECRAAGAVHYPGDAWLDPAGFCRALRNNLSAKVDFRWQQECSGIAPDGNRVRFIETTSGGKIGGDEFVFAMGAWTSLVGRWLAARMPIISGKGYSVTLAMPPQTPSVCSLWPEFRVACTPLESGLRFGGTMELGEPNFGVSRSRVEGIFESVRKMFPSFEGYDLESEPIWVGNRPCTPDGLPYIGRLAKWDNVTVAAGHAMMGLSLGPASGRLVVDSIEGHKPNAILNPNRYD